MNLKALAVGVLTLALSNSAAFAATPLNNRSNAASPIANRVTLMPIVCGGDIIGSKETVDNGFSRVVQGVYQGGYTEAEHCCGYVGFRLDANNIKTFSFTLAETGNPDVVVFFAFRSSNGNTPPLNLYHPVLLLSTGDTHSTSRTTPRLE